MKIIKFINKYFFNCKRSIIDKKRPNYIIKILEKYLQNIVL